MANPMEVFGKLSPAIRRNAGVQQVAKVAQSQYNVAKRVKAELEESRSPAQRVKVGGTVLGGAFLAGAIDQKMKPIEIRGRTIPPSVAAGVAAFVIGVTTDRGYLADLGIGMLAPHAYNSAAESFAAK